MDNEAIIRNAIISRAQISFWHFCNLLAPDFYTTNRPHLGELCRTLERLYTGQPQPDGRIYKKLIINYPPQHGKSRTLFLFCAWVMGRNQEERIITASYNDSTAQEFSRYTRDCIGEERIQRHQVVYSDIFPAKLKHGDSSVGKWALDGQHFNYLATGVGGSATSKGGTILIVDDTIKNAEEALSENHLEKIWLWYAGTFKSRVSAVGGEHIEIINHTRWAKKDLIGRLMDAPNASDWYVLCRPAHDEVNQQMLCSEMLSFKAYTERKDLAFTSKQAMSVFMANYQQKPIDVEGALYGDFKTYESLPDGIEVIRNYTDTADTGDDFLCSISYAIKQGFAYILNIVYDQSPAEVTEPLVVKLLTSTGTNEALIESNSGGRAFARNVERMIRATGHYTTAIRTFTQTKNKQTRIISNSPAVMNNVIMPSDWMHRWPKFYLDVTNYQRAGKNKHDDCADVLTGIVENLRPIAKCY